MAELAANLLQDNDNDEFPGILGMRLDTELDEDVVLPETISSEMAFASLFPSSAASVSEKAFLARRNPDTVYPAPGEQNRPPGSKEFDVSTCIEETAVGMPIEQLCENSESIRENSLMPSYHGKSHDE